MSLFPLEKLKEILHYTDLSDNPAFDAFESSEFFEIQSGAKGVSKSFNGAIITLYRLANETNFNSVWCRNQYNHIKNTLIPMFQKAADFLETKHKINIKRYLVFTQDAIYWSDGTDTKTSRKILFQNFEKIQAFQGITLPKADYYFGELVIDEPIEDPENTNYTPGQLRDLYQNQKENIPLLIQNTVLRTKAPQDTKLKVKFFYNIFTTEHFLITDYHNKVIPLISHNGTTNIQVLDRLVKDKFIYETSSTFSEGLGINVIMYSKLFTPNSEMSEIQKKQFELLKSTNFRLWVITVAGFAFVNEDKQSAFYLKSLIYDNNNFNSNIEFITKEQVSEFIRAGKVLGVFDGYDPGKSDNASWCRTLLLDDGKIVILDAIEDLKRFFKHRPTRVEVNKLLIDLIIKSNIWIFEELKNSYHTNEFFNLNKFENVILTDNDHVSDYVNLELQQLASKFPDFKIYSRLANRKDTRTEKFGIESRQRWTEWIFGNNMVYILNTNDTTKLLENLSKQYVEPGEKKRDETVFPEIYDLINAFEMSNSLTYKKQKVLWNLAQQGENYGVR
ncbi:hypothetical protein [Mycoplasma sp. 21DD0573]|uniref:hypothetical protein n=1 Tax=unclassified Mycoplasma TaxID=2683645 RepID=UPI002B1E41DC|nr:hypothetical protein [Mycoplasma sp. 21DD0573]MEA4276183.1 hypothetical protein [Mycoplasma sp. 21DD0573]